MTPGYPFHLGLAGWPLEHSHSPQIHQAALRALGLDGQYLLFPVPPGLKAGAELESLVDQMRREELHGLNVTIPYKLDILRHVDSLAPAAAAIGAANTLYMDQGTVVAENTDAAGFSDALQVEFPGFFCGSKNQTALILGAGGAARAAAYALLQSGWQVIVASRKQEAGLALVEQMKAAAQGRIKTIHLDPESLRTSINSPVALIVNATPLGMFPRVEHSPWPGGIPFPKGAVIFDMVYNPAQTRLVAAAQSAGLAASTGLSMLVEQAARAFELWTHSSFPRQAVWQELRKETSFDDTHIK